MADALNLAEVAGNQRRTLTSYGATGADRGESHHLTGYVTTVTGRQDPHDELSVLNGVDEEAIAALSRQ